MNLKAKINWMWATFFTVLAVALIFFWYFIMGIYLNQKGSYFNKEHNAIWINHEWVGEFKSDADVRNLVNTLSKHQIDTVFVHTGPIQEDGTSDPKTYHYALSFVEKAHSLNKDIKYQALLGQISGKIDLSDAVIRHAITNQTMILTRLVGFDGIHFDIEPVWDNDTDFIQLLKETREILPKEKKISVALAEFIPNSAIWMVENFYKFKNYNTQVNYLNVAKYADQVVAMAYDTSIKDAWLYKWLVKEQTIWLTRLLKGKEVFIGIPAYDDPTQNFDPNVENMENGLRGVTAGLNNIRSRESNFAGIAIYPYWEIDEKEWETYDKLWLK